ncbi:hypothetical protein GIB67_014495 [Kingdonia uniflora]|uniref:Uncharacterized protein n=1 Tax=Kingdonia uniflora TaxID=39325 RepID=A0A7J7LZ73_9MAGN|nr:hypothetical protein GIB67_014495 [Kingdonia uniflora]
MTRRPKRSAATTTLSLEVFDNEVVPSSLGTIVPNLRVATKVESERPKFSYLCRFYAFEKAHRSSRFKGSDNGDQAHSRQVRGLEVFVLANSVKGKQQHQSRAIKLS